MMTMRPFDPKLDLELTRLFTAPPAKIWRCWTEPALFVQWWTPPPVVTREAVIEAFPGGRFYSLMVMPDGTEMPNEGCVLAADREKRFVFTNLLTRDFAPAAPEEFGFTGYITMTPEGSGTRYTARAMQRTAQERDTHDSLGFHEGWGTVSDQLGVLAAGL
jgi:uncharacterized protein YndB with AHSA1/START domain